MLKVMRLGLGPHTLRWCPIANFFLLHTHASAARR